MKNSKARKKSIIHISFEIGLAVKAFDGAFEIVGAVLLLFLSPARMNSLVRFLTQHELSEDSGDVIANLLLRLAQSFSVNAQYFGVLYLAAHGIIKCFLSIFYGIKSFGHILCRQSRLFYLSPIRSTGTQYPLRCIDYSYRLRPRYAIPHIQRI